MNTQGANHESLRAWKQTVCKFVLGCRPGICSRDLQLERIKGGSYNNVLGVNIFEPRDRKLSMYNRRRIERSILRVPRDIGAFGSLYDVNILNYIRPFFKVPMPEVLAYDSTRDNTLGHPYIMQSRLRGEPLSKLLNGLKMEQKKSAVEGYGRIMRNLYELTSECAGIISLRNDSDSLAKSPILEEVPIPFDYSGFKPTTEQPRPPMGNVVTRQTPREFLISLCKHQHDYEKSQWNARHSYPYDEVWKNLVNIVKAMHEMGVLPDDEQFHFIHGDLFPRNILVRPTSLRSVEITGVIDWDMTHFGPKFMTTCPPFFFWNGGYEIAHNPIQDNDGMPEWAELKQTWDNTMGKDFCEMAYSVEYKTLRNVYYTTKWGFYGNRNTSVDTVESLLARTYKLKREKT